MVATTNALSRYASRPFALAATSTVNNDAKPASTAGQENRSDQQPSASDNGAPSASSQPSTERAGAEPLPSPADPTVVEVRAILADASLRQGAASDDLAARNGRSRLRSVAAGPGTKTSWVRIHGLRCRDHVAFTLLVNNPPPTDNNRFYGCIAGYRPSRRAEQMVIDGITKMVLHNTIMRPAIAQGSGTRRDDAAAIMKLVRHCLDSFTPSARFRLHLVPWRRRRVGTSDHSGHRSW